MNGTAADDLLIGTDLREELDGGDGNDTLIGGRGYDTLTGGAGRDTFRYRSLEELADSDWIRDFAEGDLLDLSGVAGLRIVIGESLPAGVQPSEQAPVLLVRRRGLLELRIDGSDVRSSLSLGFNLEETSPGSKILQVVAGLSLSGSGEASTLTGGRGMDTLIGGTGPERLVGGESYDSIRGGAGDDTLVGGLEYDTLSGGPGRDVFRYDSLQELIDSDWIQDFSTEDRIDLSALGSLTILEGEALPLGTVPTGTAPVLLLRPDGTLELWDSTGAARTSLPLYRAVEETEPGSRILQAIVGIVRTGTTGPDTMTGGRGDDTLSGGEGADLVSGGPGQDSLSGGDGADTLAGGSGYDILSGGLGADVIRYDSIDELIQGDQIVDFGVGDRLDLSALSALRIVRGDVLPTGLSPSESTPVLLLRPQGLLELWTQPDATLPRGSMSLGRPVEETVPGSRVLVAVAGVQRIGGEAAESLEGGIGGDTLLGGGGHDTIRGGDGDDLLWGGGGADVLLPGPGRDTLRGGGGADTFRFESLADMATDKILEALDEGDRLDFSAVPGLRILWGNTPPSDGTISPRSPVLMVHDHDPLSARQQLRLYVESPTQVRGFLSWSSTNGVLALEETERGSGILRLSTSISVQGGASDDRLVGGAGADTLSGGEGGDTLDGGAAPDILIGGPGNDILIGGAGRDTLTGGPGTDTVRYTSLDEMMSGDAIADFSGDDRLDFSAIPGLRIIFGDSLPSDVVPSDGAPVLLVGPSGVLKPYADPSRSARWMHPIHGRLVETDTGSRVLMIEPARIDAGTERADSLTGTARGDALAGGMGHDTLEGRLGDDTLLGGPGDDQLRGEDGDDELRGGAGNDGLDGGPGRDRFVYDTLPAIGESDILSNLESLDIIDVSGIAGLRLVWADTLPPGLAPSASAPVLLIKEGRLRFHQSASDFATVGVLVEENGYSGPAVVEETVPGSGLLRVVMPSVVRGTRLADTLDGGAAGERLDGGDGNDLIRGGAGADRLFGEAGQDTLNGGVGDDTLDGGPGADVYRFDSLSDVGSVEHLEVGTGDRIDFSGISGVRVMFGRTLTVSASAAAPVVLVGGDNWIYVVEDPAASWRMIWVGETNLRETAPGSGILMVEAQTQAAAEGSPLTGTPRSDVLLGAQGPDTLSASLGEDQLTGGGGADVFRFTTLEQLSTATRITDFASDDRLDLSAIPGLQIAYGEALPTGTVPSVATPWLLVRGNGLLDVYDGTVSSQFNGSRADVVSGPVVAGNPILRETQAGSRVLQIAPTSPTDPPTLTTRWFGADGVQKAGSFNLPIQLVMMSEGYAPAQADVFFATVQALTARMFANDPTSAFDPLDDYAGLFEVVAYFIPSSAGAAGGGASGDTPFRSGLYDNIGAVGGDTARAVAIAAAQLPGTAARVPVVLLNTDYGRSTGGSAIWLVAGMGTDDSNVLVHEMGHALFGFADEYADLGISLGYPAPLSLRTAHLASSPREVPWSHWLGFEDDLGIVGAFEGGLYRETGVWRATATSMMFANGNAFNAPQKEAMVARLHELWGDYLALGLDARLGLQAQSHAPDVLRYEWRLDGRLLEHTGSSLSVAQLQALGLSPGSRHTVEVQTVDDSGWLRLPSLQAASRQTERAELVWGAAGGDSIIGTAGSEWLFGGAGQERLHGQAGDDWLDGGDGRDEALYGRPRAEYQVSRSAQGHLVVDGPDGRDTLVNIERVRFQDGALAFDADGIGGKTYRLYKAAFDRVPDPAGIGFWMAFLDNGFDMLTAARNFLDSDEFRALYDNDPNTPGYQDPSIETFVTKIYRHVLQRSPEGEGYTFWVDAMYNRGGAFGKAYSRAEVLIAFAESTENKVNVVGLIEQGFSYLPFTLPGG